jgi:hypothetical protein
VLLPGMDLMLYCFPNALSFTPEKCLPSSLSSYAILEENTVDYAFLKSWKALSACALKPNYHFQFQIVTKFWSNLLVLFFFWWDWGLNSGLHAWTMPLVHFALLILKMRFLGTICFYWPRTIIFPISASQGLRIIGMSHWHSAPSFLFNTNTYL